STARSKTAVTIPSPPGICLMYFSVTLSSCPYHRNVIYIDHPRTGREGGPSSATGADDTVICGPRCHHTTCPIRLAPHEREGWHRGHGRGGSVTCARVQEHRL